MSDEHKQRQLVEVLASLRADIAEAIEQGKDEGIQFEMGEVEVELKAAITEAADLKSGGKLSFSIFGVGAEAGGDLTDKAASEYAHTIKFKLKPLRMNPETGDLTGFSMSDAD